MKTYPKKSVSLHKDDSMFSWLGLYLELPVSNARLFGVLHLVDALIHHKTERLCYCV